MGAALKAARAVLALALLASATAAIAQERLQHALGDFELRVVAGGVLVAAPHGTHDTYTPGIALQASRQLGASLLVARRFRADNRRINVNRPTEGAQLPCAQEVQSDRAREVYEAYLGLAGKAADGGALRLYVEVHGNADPRSATHLEVGARGLTVAEARAVKAAYGALLAKVREETPGYPALELLMEPADRIHFGAGCAKKLGILGDPVAPRAIHFEFPRSARELPMLNGSAALVAGIVRALLAGQ